VVVCHPPQVKLIAAALVKTDKKDTMTLAKLLAVGMIPPVWVPPVHVRELRALINHRQRLIAQQTRTKNRLRSLLQRQHLVPPDGDLFSNPATLWHSSPEPPKAAPARFNNADNSSLLEEAKPNLTLERDRAGPSRCPPPQLPGIGWSRPWPFSGRLEIERFPTAKKLVGYAGLGAKIHASGQTHRTGGITKQGRKELRQVLIEAAWIAVRYHPAWLDQFVRLADRIGRHKAIVAIARKLLVIIWHVLTTHVADRQADPVQVAKYFIRWGRQLRVKTTQGLKASEFARQQLDRLGLGSELTQVNYGSCTYRLTPPASAEPEAKPPVA
jgi:hypothetical protein